MVHGYLDMLDPADFPPWQPMLAEMQKQSQRMTRLVEDLLTLSRLESRDSLPEEPVATLLLPMHAPWSKTAELIDYVRAVDADQAYAIHDALLSEVGLGVVRSLLGERGPGTPTPFSRIAPGDSVEL